MKTIKTFTFTFCFLNFIIGYSQEKFKAEFFNASNEMITTCDCNTISENESIRVRVYLTENVFKYDGVQFKFVNAETGRTVLPYEWILGDIMRAEHGQERYIEFNLLNSNNIQICTEKEDVYNLSVSVEGYMITGYSEELVGTTIKKTPIYGQGTAFGWSNSLSVDTNAKQAAKRRTMAIVGGCLFAALMVGFIVVF